MHRLEPVIWARGTLLNPQHLQTQDRYLESSLHFTTKALHFAPWGFRELQIDQDALASGSLAITRASGIMPDGLVFDMPDSDSTPPLRSFAEHFGAQDTNIDLFLVIPEHKDGGANVAGPTRQSLTRYSAEPQLLRDENTGETERTIILARKNFRLLTAGENREGFTALKIARVEKSRSGLFRLSSHFVPPLLDFRTSGYLTSIARRLLELLSARATSLAPAPSANPVPANMTITDIPQFWLRYTVNTFLPIFHHVFATRGGHPELLFKLMLELAGALTTFSNRVQPGDLPLYDHDDLGPRFTSLDEKLRILLETVIQSHVVSLRLKLVEPSIYATSLDRDEYLSKTRMYFALRAGMPLSDLIRKTPSLIKISSRDFVEHLIGQALEGIPLTHTRNLPPGIEFKGEREYFSLEQRGEAWEAIIRDRNVTAYVPEDFADPEMELLILLPGRTQSD